jgi:hypothetical protein
MGGNEGIVTLVISIAVVLFVPALIWVTLIAGLVQIVRDKTRETRPAQTESGPEGRRPIGSNGVP